ncbi:tRNA lysidine(34) synthetase TilS [Citricoccus muralis]|uniref:tRNA lysidine(34) synthetase TilS n=1 Tax=Citricoccus muralis TaxID=169134 RepID=UPI001FE78514|nr:tRNA lysidine(34) synthetase TilS [Citricoccus muralis]
MDPAHPGDGLSPVPDGQASVGPDTRTTPAGPETWPPATRWPEALHRAVHAVAAATQGRRTPLVGLSGGADSLALAVVTAEAVRTRANPALAGGAGAVVVDHGLQAGSAAVADRAAAIARRLGLEPVVIERVQVTAAGAGPEAAARQARYAALEAAAQRLDSGAVLLAHTRDDQAEQVLLGLARGSGTRSLAGIPRRRGLILRPLLDLTRQETEAICRWAGVRWWQDPANADPAYLRSRLRARVLPALEDPVEGLGPGLSAALARSADIAAEDADALEQWASREYSRLVRFRSGEHTSGTGSRFDITAERGANVSLPLEELAALPDAIRYRVIGSAVVAAGGERPSRERVLAVDRLIAGRISGGTSAGPVQLPGGVVSRRRRTGGYATLDFDAGAVLESPADPPDPPAPSR